MSAGFRSIDYTPIYKIPVEVALMHKAAGGPESVGKFAAVSLLDWYYLDQDLILVTERPVPSEVLTTYLDSQGGIIEEQEAKTFLNQLVDATDEMHHKVVFHRDIKSDNILVEIGSSVLCVRLVNFGCGSFVQERPHHTFSGTLACAPPEWYVRGEYKAGPTTVWQLGALLYRLLHGFRNSTMGILCGKMQLSRDSATQLSQENKSKSTESGSVSRKRKASIDLEAPEKRYKHSCKTTNTSEPSYMLFEEVSTRGGKREALNKSFLGRDTRPVPVAAPAAAPVAAVPAVPGAAATGVEEAKEKPTLNERSPRRDTGPVPIAAQAAANAKKCLQRMSRSY
ncbi:uncharacterized protein [Thunnus thynnus]|uniref:uncharacterized protein n=1 Tax=Thunnus thynnus TaxID=8237 RepID=UPI003528C912